MCSIISYFISSLCPNRSHPRTHNTRATARMLLLDLFTKAIQGPTKPWLFDSVCVFNNYYHNNYKTQYTIIVILSIHTTHYITIHHHNASYVIYSHMFYTLDIKNYIHVQYIYTHINMHVYTYVKIYCVSYICRCSCVIFLDLLDASWMVIFHVVLQTPEATGVIEVPVQQQKSIYVV